MDLPLREEYCTYKTNHNNERVPDEIDWFEYAIALERYIKELIEIMQVDN